MDTYQIFKKWNQVNKDRVRMGSFFFWLFAKITNTIMREWKTRFIELHSKM